MTDPLVPDGEGLRCALVWLGQRQNRSAADIEEAARRFDLSPADEEFLLRHFRVQSGQEDE